MALNPSAPANQPAGQLIPDLDQAARHLAAIDPDPNQSTTVVMPDLGYTPRVADYPEAGVRFLIRAIGPTTLVAIQPDSSAQPHGFWSDESSIDAAAHWAEQHNHSGWNLYFTANLPRAGTPNKPAKDGIEAVRCFYADLDVKDGRTPQHCVAAIRSLPLAPSLIIATGGGFQPIWLLDTPRPTTDSGVCEWAEGVGRRLRAMLPGSDAVQTIDRILRLPFTKNYPTEKKRRAGRVICCSGLVVESAP